MAGNLSEKMSKLVPPADPDTGRGGPVGERGVGLPAGGGGGPAKPGRGRGGHLDASARATKRITLDLPASQDEVLAELAIDLGGSKAVLLRVLIDELVDHPERHDQIRDRIREARRS